MNEAGVIPKLLGLQDTIPKEIIHDCATGIDIASFGYYEGKNIAKHNNLSQGGCFYDLIDDKFLVCCGDVMLRVEHTDYPDIKRRII